MNKINIARFVLLFLFLMAGPVFSEEASDIHIKTELAKKGVLLPITNHEKNLYMTVKIETESGAGTGFLLRFRDYTRGEGSKVICLVTNRHIIEPAPGQKRAREENNYMRLYFHTSKLSSKLSIPTNFNVLLSFKDGYKDLWYLPHEKCSFNQKQRKSNNNSTHYETDYDVAFFNITDLLKNISDRINHRKPWGVDDLYYECVDVSDSDYELPYKLQKMDQHIKMIGYPDGLWDEKHNYPLSRRGDPATHPDIDFNGKKEFLINIAMTKGSSGSLVVSEEGDFLGMVYGGPSHQQLNNVLKKIGADYKKLLQKMKEMDDRAKTDRGKIEGLEEDVRSLEERNTGLLVEEEQAALGVEVADIATCSNYINLGHVIKATQIIKLSYGVTEQSMDILPLLRGYDQGMVGCIGEMNDLVKLKEDNIAQYSCKF